MSQMKAPEWMRETWNRIDDAEEFQEKPSLGWIETSFEPCGAPTAFANLFNRERILKIWIIDRVYPSLLLRNCFKSFMAAVPSNAVFVQGFMFREISPQRRTNKSGVLGIIKTSSFPIVSGNSLGNVRTVSRMPSHPINQGWRNLRTCSGQSQSAECRLFKDSRLLKAFNAVRVSIGVYCFEVHCRKSLAYQALRFFANINLERTFVTSRNIHDVANRNQSEA